VGGHVSVRKGKRGDVFYAKYRLPDGHQVQQRLGPAWSTPGRPPSGFYTRRTAELALAAIITDARRAMLPGMRRTGATFADAAASRALPVVESAALLKSRSRAVGPGLARKR